MNSVTINGKTYTSQRSIAINNNSVIIDGVNVTPDEKTITIAIEGNVNSLSVDACHYVTITGDVGSIKTLSGDVTITGEVNGNVQTMSGDVECGKISGSVKTMSGDIRNYK